MLPSTFDAALFAGTDEEKLAWRFPTMTAATATTTMANTAAIAISATSQTPSDIDAILIPFLVISLLEKYLRISCVYN